MTDVNRGKATLWYVHDPMCSWCWAFAPMWQRLRDSLPETLAVRRLLGGLAPDSDQPMPAELQQYLQQTWRRIARQVPGTRFNHDFWVRCRPRRSTYPACRAVLAARDLDPVAEEPMIEAIQHAYYLEARNPSDSDTLVGLAERIGLDRQPFAQRLHGGQTVSALRQEITHARGMGGDSFPTLRLQHAGGIEPIAVDYLTVTPMAEAIGAALDRR